MALTLAIVSFSCTGPILGTLLAGTLGGDVSTVTFLGLEFKMVSVGEKDNTKKDIPITNLKINLEACSIGQAREQNEDTICKCSC